MKKNTIMAASAVDELNNLNALIEKFRFGLVDTEAVFEQHGLVVKKGSEYCLQLMRQDRPTAARDAQKFFYTALKAIFESFERANRSRVVADVTDLDDEEARKWKAAVTAARANLERLRRNDLAMIGELERGLVEVARTRDVGRSKRLADLEYEYSLDTTAFGEILAALGVNSGRGR